MCFAPQRRALFFGHLNFQKWSGPGVFCTFWLRNVLRATTACTFSTSQLPKVLRTWGVFSFFTCKCASRQNGVTHGIRKTLRNLHAGTFGRISPGYPQDFLKNPFQIDQEHSRASYEDMRRHLRNSYQTIIEGLAIQRILQELSDKHLYRSSSRSSLQGPLRRGSSHKNLYKTLVKFFIKGPLQRTMKLLQDRLRRTFQGTMRTHEISLRGSQGIS